MSDNSSSHRSMSPAPISSVEGGPNSPVTTARTSPPASSAASKQQKQRTGSTSDTNGGPKITKRRAARACVSCRARKVRCDVVEGAPCGNCRWDNVECVVQESRRRKKNLYTAPLAAGHVSGTEALRASTSSNPVNITSADLRKASTVSHMSGIENAALNPAPMPTLDSLDGVPLASHVPHLIYQRSSAAAVAAAAYPTDTAALLAKLGDASGRALWPNPPITPTPVLGDIRTAQFLNTLDEPDLLAQLPAFIKPLPSKIAPEDVEYLYKKGALTLPPPELQRALIRAYVEYLHPYVPLLELHSFLNTVASKDGLNGQVSLFLYQAVMFSATAYVEAKYLREAGYPSRRAARKSFFQKTRLLYDFDYESDRLVLVQGLLLMTYWYETPDDQKDTWHWMGVAISLAHTIGLHRNPANSMMPLPKQKLWKRIWWSCFLRDRLIALGMRRPTRIQETDFDVPMLQESDFEIEALSDDNELLGPECRLVRDLEMQKELSSMCIQMMKLCVCVSHMLKAQYSVLNRDGMRPGNTTDSTMMLFPNKTMDNVEHVHMVDMELMNWFSNLPQICQYRPLTPYDVKDGRSTVGVQRNLLHMVYHTTVSALHRPQFLPQPNAPPVSRQIQEMSRMRVRDAAGQITQMAAELHHYRLERYLPTSGVTVILPAMIIHLLEMKSPLPDVRQKATKGFRQCMKVMEKLRDIYAAADFATGFLDAALRKAAIDVHAQAQNAQQQAVLKSLNGAFSSNFNNMPTARSEEHMTPPPDNAPYLTPSEIIEQYTRTRTLAPRNVELSQGVAGGQSPPHTETHSDGAEGTTPSASGSSPRERDAMEVDMTHGQDVEFDWNAMTGPNLDFDQWLQFPAEGVNNTDGDFMGMFASGAPTPAPVNEHGGMDWITSAKEMQPEATVAA
ncbi:cutinase transcription factor 1 [Coniochaeta sp. 2T2.1]|nr:cutinase transcription factor 1 [Coniochaeta sp. 2T2.1]